MDTPPPDDVDPRAGTPPPEPPILLPAADLPPMEVANEDSPVVVSRWVPATRPPLPHRTVVFLTTLGIGAVVYFAFLMIGGPAGQFASDGLEVLPFVGLALLSYAGERSDTFKLLTLIYWVLLVGLAVMVSVALTSVAECNVSVLLKLQEAARTGKPSPVSLREIFLPGAGYKIAIVSVACLFAVIVGTWGLSPTARQWASRVLPSFDPESFVHAIALATVAAMSLILFAPLVATGEPPILTIIRNVAAVDFGEQGQNLMAAMSEQNLLLDQVYSFLWLVPMGIVVVGWPLHRTLPSAFRRVGFVIPQPWHIGFGLLLAVFLAVIMPGLVDPAIGRLWDWMHWPRTDEKAFEQLFKSMASPVGAVVIGVTAGIGEELFARGVLQPRLGILLANLFFVSLHALQYNWDALLSVFIAGMILGVVRKKTNTATSAIVHGTYDFLLVMAAVYPQYDPSKWFGWG